MSINNVPSGSNPARHSDKDRNSYTLALDAFDKSSLSNFEKLEAFPRFTSKRALARFLVKSEIFNKILHVNGAIVECGVFNGAGLFTWAQLSNIYEPINYNRKIIGFDTFEGFPSVDEEKDNVGSTKNSQGDLRGSSLDELNASIDKYNHERHLSHISNIELVAGDFNSTAGEFFSKRPHLIVSLLYLDFDLYSPTKTALETIVPRMPKGSIIAFDELNCENFAGETLAFDEVLGIRNHKIHRSTIDPWVSYIVME